MFYTMKPKPKHETKHLRGYELNGKMEVVDKNGKKQIKNIDFKKLMTEIIGK